jgi:dTDP-4-amino-4,6-dideoxygalactose transaminase
MSGWKVPLADLQVTESDIAAVADTYRSGWLSMGPQTARLEEDFARYTGAAQAIAVANGTAALHLICAAAGLGPGDEVIVPSLTFVATANAIAYTGARPVFADIAGLDAPWLSAAAAESALSARTKAIMAMSYGGYAGEVEALRALADRHDLLLLEDAAHAVGARLDGRHLGTFGAASAFSFFSNKNLAVGEGGMVITDDDALAERVRLLRSHGMTTLTWDRHRGHAASYDVIALGYNYRIDEPRAVLAQVRLKRVEEENRRRGQLDARYREQLIGAEGVSLLQPPPQRLSCSHHLFAIVLDEGLDREAFRSALGAKGLQTSVHYPPVHRFEIYREGAPALPVTDAYAARSVTLPMFPHMTLEQQDLVIEAVREAVTAELTPRSR